MRDNGGAFEREIDRLRHLLLEFVVVVLDLFLLVVLGAGSEAAAEIGGAGSKAAAEIGAGASAAAGGGGAGEGGGGGGGGPRRRRRRDGVPRPPREPLRDGLLRPLLRDPADVVLALLRPPALPR